MLGTLLVSTNMWWMYVTMDNAVTASYREDQLSLTRQALGQLLFLIPELKATATKKELVAAAERLFKETAFEKDGCIWVGRLGLKFDDNDRLVHVAPAWNSGEEGICWQQ